MNRLVLLVLGFFVTSLGAEVESPLTLKDFRASQSIELEGAGALYRLDLPDSIYQKVSHDDLRDVRIFNADGNVVPHSFQWRSAVLTQVTSAESLAYFPIEGTENDSSGESEIVLSENQSGRVVKVRLKGREKETKAIRVGYLVDLRKQKKALRSLTLDWESKRKNGIINVDLSASDDLRSWHPVERGVSLARFAFHGHDLEKNTIDLPEIRAPFLRISWKGDNSFQINNLKGDFVAGDWVEAKRSEVAVSPTLNEKGFYYFEKPPFLTDRLEIELPEVNTVLQVVVSSRANDQSVWYPRFSGTIYRIKQEDGSEMASGAEKVMATSDRFWRMQIEGKDASVGSQMPTFKFGWVAHQIFFLARGNAPFQIAYGSSKAGTPDFGFGSLVESLPNKDDIQPKWAKVTGGEKLTEVVPEPVVVPPVPWKKYALWAALTGALLLSSLMAWKLYRDLNKSA